MRDREKPIEILLVDDDESDVRLVVEGFKESRILNTLHTAEDGEKALAFLRRGRGFEKAPRPDLILLDINLPRKNGLEVLTELKADPKLSTIPVVMLTSSAAHEDIVRSYKSHANCYITKPVDLEQLFKVVRAVDHFWFSVVRLPPVKA